MADAADPAASVEMNESILSSLDAFVKGGGLARAEREAAKELGLEDAEGGDNEPEPGETESRKPRAQAQAKTEQAEAGSEDDDEPEPDETESTDEEPPQKFKVTVDGEEVEVTLDEALAGYSREADYRRKTAAHADTIRNWEGEKERTLKADRDAIATERAQYSAVLELWESQYQKVLGKADDLAELRHSNPAEWSARMTERRQWQDNLVAITAERQKLAKQDEDRRTNELKQKFATEAKKMLDAIPAWKDQKTYLADSQRIYDYAQAAGYTPEEVHFAVASDHRLAQVLMDALQYRALQQKKPDAQRRVETARPLPPGPGARQSRGSTLAKLREEQAKRGDGDSTVALFDHLLRNGGLGGPS